MSPITDISVVSIVRWVATHLVAPLILGICAVLWRLGYDEWTDREDRLDSIEQKLNDLEGAVNGGEQADGIQAEVHEIKEMLQKAESES